MFHGCKCSLDLLYLTVKISSHQQSPGVVHLEFFVTRFKIEETDHLPDDYLVTLSLSADLLDREIQVIGSLNVETTLLRFLQNLLGTVPASIKLSSIEVVSKLADREPKSEAWSKEFQKG